VVAQVLVDGQHRTDFRSEAMGRWLRSSTDFGRSWGSRYPSKGLSRALPHRGERGLGGCVRAGHRRVRRARLGVGMDSSILDASLEAVISAANRAA